MNGKAERAGGRTLAERIAAAPRTVDRRRASAFVDDLVAAADGNDCPELAAISRGEGPARDLLAGALEGSPWLRGVLTATPAIAECALACDPDERLDALCRETEAAVATAGDREEAMATLRRFKADGAALVALSDLAGAWSLEAVTAAMTRLADTAIRAAVAFLLREAAERGAIELANPESPGEGSGLVLLAMGKHGAGELNFSSDVDLIALYDPTRARLAAPDEAAKFYIRLVRDLVKLMQEHTGDGYVFRTDLRLRPDPGATAVAISIEAALEYYESLGQNWERAALLKARPCAGDVAGGEHFLEEIAPFIWRKYMDFAALADVHAMKRQIHAAKGHSKVAVLGHNLKLGRGGIREIEFFVQTQQLVAGGRHPELRVRRTLDALDRLAEGGWIDSAARDELGSAYRFLRGIEHRLQMIADEQTHTLPDTQERLAEFARFAGYEDADAFSEALLAHMRAVQRHYAQLFEDAPELSSAAGSLVFTGDDDDPETLETLSRMGYGQPKEVTAAVRSWHFGRIPAARSARAREVLTEITPALLDHLAGTANPDAAFVSFDRFLQRLPAGVQVFTLLRSNPQILGLLADVMGTAPRLADLLGRRPRVFAAVLEPDFFDALPDRATLSRFLDETLAEADGYEDALDRARIFGQEHAFLIGVRVLSGTVSAGDAGAAFTRLADLLVDRLHWLAREHLAEAHGQIDAAESALVALGKLGGGEMTASSDLDLILLYDTADDTAASDGARPLAPSQYFMRLTQRLVAALSAPTAEGTLYEVDMRLRPSGNAGPLATHVDSFASYQQESAWTWEHMALTRARVISGPSALRERIESIIADVLGHPRDADRLIADILDMRARIHREKGSHAVWDLKTVRGGVVDVEFVAQYLQLAHGHTDRRLRNRNTQAVLTAARQAGVLERRDAEALEPAAGLYESVTQVLRLCLTKPFDPQSAPRGLATLLCKAADVPDLSRLEASLRDAQAGVDAAFRRILGEWE